MEVKNWNVDDIINDKSSAIIDELSLLIDQVWECFDNSVDSSEKAALEVQVISANIYRILDLDIPCNKKVEELRKSMTQIIEWLISVNTTFKSRITELQEKNEWLKTEIKETKQLAHTDDLTKLYNKSKLKEVVSVILEKYNANEKYKDSLWFCFLSINNLNDITEQFWEEIKNDILLFFSIFMIQQFKQKWIAFRISWNEFIMVSWITITKIEAFLNTINQYLKKSDGIDSNLKMEHYDKELLESVNSRYKMIKELYWISLSFSWWIIPYSWQEIEDILTLWREYLFRAQNDWQKILLSKV